eukprot:scaffold7.g3623.t1
MPQGDDASGPGNWPACPAMQVYIGVEARFQYGMEWWRVSLLLASYQITRAVANGVMPRLGHVAGHAAGAAAGLAGYLVQGASRGRVQLFWGSTMTIALSEVIVPMQQYVKQEVGPLGAVRLCEALRLQYASNVAGTSVGFLGCAVLYHWGSGVSGVARLGAALEAAELAALAAFLALPFARPDPPRPASLAPGPAGARTSGAKQAAPREQGGCRAGLDGDALPAPAREGGGALELQQLASATDAPDGLDPSAPRPAGSGSGGGSGGGSRSTAAAAAPPPVPWISYVVVATFAVQALCIGCVLSTAPILYHNTYQLDLSCVGLLFGAGETAGTLILLARVPASRQQRLRRIFRAPVNLMVTLALVGCTTLLYIVPSRWVAMAATVSVMALNDLATSMCTELQGGSVHEAHYLGINVAGNLARRVGNTCTALLGPLLYCVAPWVPFVAVGAATLAWVGVLAAAMSARAREAAELDTAAAGGSKPPPRRRGLGYYLHNRTFVSSELAMLEHQQQQRRHPQHQQHSRGCKKAHRRRSCGYLAMAAEGLTEYELARLEQVRRNQEKLQAMGIPALARELMPPKPAPAVKPKGLSTRKRRLTEDAAAPRRASSRLRGETAEGGEVLSERAGKVTVAHVKRGGHGRASPLEPPPPKERHPKGDLPFRSTNATPATDEAFIQLLAHLSSSAPAGAASPPAAGGRPRARGGAGKGAHAPLGAAQAARLALAQDDVAKVTKEAVAHLAFHPTTSTLLLAASDKQGNVGLWHCNHGKCELLVQAARQPPILAQQQQAVADGAGRSAGAAGDAAAGAAAATGREQQLEAEEEQFDGVLLTSPHYQYISGLKWAGGAAAAAQLFTVSYDGSARALDVATGTSQLLLSTEDAEFSAFDVTADGRRAPTAVLGDNDGELCVLDCRANAPAAQGLTVAARKVNTVSIDVSERLVATASTDTAGSQRIVSTSFDNTVRVWDARAGLAQLVRVKHNNNTGRYIMPFRAQWTPAADGFVVGSMQRCLDVFDASGALLSSLGSEHMTAIPARACLHPGLPAMAGATASGRLHLFR